MKLEHFKHENFLSAIKNLFRDLNVPMNYLADEAVKAKDILKETYKDGKIDYSQLNQYRRLLVEKFKYV